jgi:hypothetical protein
MTVLDRAKTLQLKVASETACWVRLDLFEAMIAEIERLQAYEKAHPATAARSLSEIGQRHAGGT